MPRSSIKRSDVRTQVGRMTGALRWRSTATGGTTATLIDTKTTSADTAFFQGRMLILRPGLSTQEKRYLGAYTVASDTWAIAPVLTTLPSSGDVYEVWDESVISVDQVEGIIDQVFGQVFHASGLRFSNTSLIVDDVLYGLGDFEGTFTTDGTYTTLPPGWAGTGTGAVTKATLDTDAAATASKSIARWGLGAAKLVNTAANALTINHYILRPNLLAGSALELRGWVNSDTASRADLRIFIQGAASSADVDKNATDHAGGTAWEEIKVASATVPANVEDILVSLRISSGDAANVYFDNVRCLVSSGNLTANGRLRTYPLFFSVDRIESIWMEDYQKNFTVPIHRWRVEDEDGFPVLIFDDRGSLIRDRHLLVLGTQVPGRWTDDTTTVSLTDEQYTALVSNSVSTALASIGATSDQELARLQWWDSKGGTDIARADNRRAGSRRVF